MIYNILLKETRKESIKRCYVSQNAKSKITSLRVGEFTFRRSQLSLMIHK